MARSINSIVNQTYKDWEIIIVDDASQDGTTEHLQSLIEHDPRIILRTHPKNLGAQAARNTGIRAASGEWITFLDSDDEYLPDSLLSRITLADQSGVQVVHSACSIEIDGCIQEYPVPPLTGYIHRDLLKMPGPVFSALLVSRSALESINLLDEEIVSFQEWDTAIRLARKYQFGFVSQPTFIYHRDQKDTISGNPSRTITGYLQIINRNYQDIIRFWGKSGLSHHYDSIAQLAYQGGLYHEAGKYAIKALKTFPFVNLRQRLKLMIKAVLYS